MDVNAVDREKRTALHWACTNNALPCVNALIAAKADVNARDFAGLMPIHCACPLDAVDSVRALLAAGAGAETADRDNRTPLHWAADRSADECMKSLLEAGAKVDTTDWNGYAALHYAARRSAAGCVRLLLEKGADRGLASARGETAADLATDEEIRRSLEKPGLKRKRSLSSNSLQLEQELPSLAEKVFLACQQADRTQLQELCTPELWATLAAEVERQFAGKAAISLGQIHACTRSLTACVELKASAASLLLLTFNQDGLLTAFKLYVSS